MKFKVGDVVECIEGVRRGAGWKLGQQFEITFVTERTTSNPIYWKDKPTSVGVYEDSLKLVRSKGDEIIYA